MKQEPLYRWELADGVINLVPIRNRDPFFESLLNTAISNYDPGKWTIKFQLRDAIGSTPEVKKLLESKNVELARYRDYASYPSIPRRSLLTYECPTPRSVEYSIESLRSLSTRAGRSAGDRERRTSFQSGYEAVFVNVRMKKLKLRSEICLFFIRPEPNRPSSIAVDHAAVQHRRLTRRSHVAILERESAEINKSRRQSNGGAGAIEPLTSASRVRRPYGPRKKTD